MDYSKMTNEDLEQLVNNKDPDAMCELAERCLNGTMGHEKNMNRAYQLLHKGEKLGSKKAYAGFAFMYKNGIYFAQNERISKEYEEKADGVQWLNVLESDTEKKEIEEEKRREGERRKEEKEKKQNSLLLIQQVSELLGHAENYRVQGNYLQVKTMCHEALNLMQNAGDISNELEIDKLRIRAHWILAFTAFNEQNLHELEVNAGEEGVKALYPWVNYLLAIMHKENQVSPDVLETDLGTCMMVCDNPNLSSDERGDICVMVGDLLTEGYGKQYGNTKTMAKDFYLKAANSGNMYAKEILRK